VEKIYSRGETNIKAGKKEFEECRRRHREYWRRESVKHEAYMRHT
jgi:hypothetical protein